MTDRNAFMYDTGGKLRPEYSGSTEDGSPTERRIQVGQKSQIFPGQAVLGAIAVTTPPFVNPMMAPPLETLIVKGNTDPIGKTSEPHPAHGFLKEAAEVMEQRAKLRDKPQGERSMGALVKTFNALTNHNLTEDEGWEFMILLKMVRGRQGNYNRDDYVDGSAYFGLLGECKSNERKE
jgi:Domain of unknown function (DUF6378)